MEKTTVQVELREVKGKGISRRLRREDKIPAVVYGKGVEPTKLSFNPKILRLFLQASETANPIINLDIQGDKPGQKMVLLKEVQRHPLTRDWTHADFVEINMSDAITVDVGIHYEGKAKGTVEGGIVEIKRREVEVSCLPKDIPDHIVVDISDLDMGSSLHISDIKLPKGVTMEDSVHLTLVTVVHPDAEEVKVEVAPEAAVAEPGKPEAGGDVATGKEKENKG